MKKTKKIHAPAHLTPVVALAVRPFAVVLVVVVVIVVTALTTHLTGEITTMTTGMITTVSSQTQIHSQRIWIQASCKLLLPGAFRLHLRAGLRHHLSSGEDRLHHRSLMVAGQAKDSRLRSTVTHLKIEDMEDSGMMDNGTMDSDMAAVRAMADRAVEGKGTGGKTMVREDGTRVVTTTGGSLIARLTGTMEDTEVADSSIIHLTDLIGTGEDTAVGDERANTLLCLYK